MDAITFRTWALTVKLVHGADVKFTIETGHGETYADVVGTVTAHTGPDMQANVVGWWDWYNKYSCIFGKEGETLFENHPDQNAN